jgi:hypothetical protein
MSERTDLEEEKTKKVVDTARITHCLDSQLTDGGKVVSRTLHPFFSSLT